MPFDTSILVLLELCASNMKVSSAQVRDFSYCWAMGFRENLRSQLEYLGMPVKELAARSGIKKRTIESYLGTRSYKPSAEAAVSIAKALGVTVEYLVTDADGKEESPPSALSSDIQEILFFSKRLSRKDRHILLTLARLLGSR